DGSVIRNLRWFPERSHNIEDRVSGLERVEQRRGLARRLHNDVDCSLLRIRILDGHRYAFTLLINPKNDELARLLLARNTRSFDHKPLDPRRKKLCVDDFEHRRSPLATRPDSTS